MVFEKITFSDLTLNLSSCDLCCHSRSIRLSYKEFEILKILMASPKMIISKETLITKVWGDDSEAQDNNVEAYISFIRKTYILKIQSNNPHSPQNRLSSGGTAMLKQLKHKFIWINMSLVCIVLLAVLSILCIDSYRKYELESQKAMEQALDHSMFNPSETDSENMTSEEKEKKELPPIPGNGRIFTNMIPVYVITLDSKKNIQSIDSTRTDFSEEFINTAAEAAQKAQAQSGYLPDFGMRFMISDTQDGTKIVLADLVHEISALRSLILNCILIFIITTIIFFFISFFLARWALKPVKTAWQQQNQFIADASHELKTPLTVILANLKIITTHMDSTVKDQEIWLKNTLFEAEHMKKLVENLLFLARSQAGMLTFPDTTVNFSDLVLNTLLPFEAVAFEQGIILEEHIENDITIPGKS